jgi:hypothetical protein
MIGCHDHAPGNGLYAVLIRITVRGNDNISGIV